MPKSDLKETLPEGTDGNSAATENTEHVVIGRLKPGTLLAGKYLIERVLARGGVGIVVAAKHVELDRPVAIKYLQAPLENGPVVERFLREARLAAKIRSNHVVRVHDVAKDAALGPYMVMEYLEGEDLDAVIARGALPVPHAVDYVIQACDALAEAHALGIVHRDLKPGNLFLARLAGGSSVVKIIDFGISKVAPKRGSSGEWLHLTTASETFGSPVYMSPEQLRSAAKVDARADIWAVGVVLFELLTGSLPFAGLELPQLCTSILCDAPKSLRDLCPAAPPELETVIRRCLEKEPDARYHNIAEVVQDLEPFVLASGGTADRIAHIKRVVREFESIRPPSLSSPSFDVNEIGTSPTMQFPTGFVDSLPRSSRAAEELAKGTPNPREVLPIASQRPAATAHRSNHRSPEQDTVFTPAAMSVEPARLDLSVQTPPPISARLERSDRRVERPYRLLAAAALGLVVATVFGVQMLSGTPTPRPSGAGAIAAPPAPLPGAQSAVIPQGVTLPGQPSHADVAIPSAVEVAPPVPARVVESYPNAARPSVSAPPSTRAAVERVPGAFSSSSAQAARPQTPSTTPPRSTPTSAKPSTAADDYSQFGERR